MPVQGSCPMGFYSSSWGQGSDHKRGSKPISEGNRMPERRIPVEGRWASTGPTGRPLHRGEFSCASKGEEAGLAGSGGGVPGGKQEGGSSMFQEPQKGNRPPACASCLSRPLLSWPLCHPPASRHSHAPGGKWEASKPFYRCGGQGWELE